MSEPHPFLFYGRRPADWYEGANDGHPYEVRFVSAADDATRAALAGAFERALVRSAVTPSARAWRWSGNWALFFVGERNAGRAEALFDGMERLARALHAVAPIAEVVYWGMRAPGRHEWDLWTLATQPSPSSGPPHPTTELMVPRVHGQQRDLSLALSAADPAFEAERKKSR